MSYPHSYRLGPVATPRSLKLLILATLVLSLFSGLADRLFPQIFHLISPQKILGISLWGVDHYFYWQFLSYLLIHPLEHGLSFSYLLSLAFNLYVLWLIGSSLIDKRGTIFFYGLYLSSGLVGGLTAFLIQWLTGSAEIFSGNWTALYALLISWIMVFPGMELLLFLTIPIKAKWLVLGMLAANLMIDLSLGDFITTSAYLLSALFGYLYTANFTFKEGYSSTSTFSRAKIFDFKTGKAILNDEEFLEAMLTKISLHGKDSLTWKERLRLRRIARKKRPKS